MNPIRLQFRRTASKWQLQVKQSLKRHHITRFDCTFHNQVRLLNWKVWSLRYGVSLNWIVDHLLEYYSKARAARDATTHLGLSISSITGEKALQNIQDFIFIEFPNGENLAAQRSELQTKMLGVPNLIKSEQDLTVEEYIQCYRYSTEQVRAKASMEAAKYTRPWRGNPFL